jgi:uncharacterized protein
VSAERELPVVWAVAKGSALNKLILVPVALALAAFAPWAVIPLLMLGGAYLCYEGVEKLAHPFLHSKGEDDAHRSELSNALSDPNFDLVAFEREKIKGAIRTDFILSAEIIVISLGTVTGKPFATQLGVLSAIAVVMTVGVYGLVAGIVKLDDFGLYLTRFGGLRASIGRGLVAVVPYLMRFLSIAGTAAMFLVGGGILVHGVHALDLAIKAFAAPLGGFGAMVVPQLANVVVGIIAGAIVLAVVSLGVKLFKKS